MSRIPIILIPFLLVAACGTGNQAGNVTVVQRTPPPAAMRDSLVDIPQPPTMRERDVLLFFNDKAVTVRRTFIAQVTARGPGRIEFDDGHVLLYGLPPGHHPHLDVGMPLRVMYQPAPSHFTDLRTVVVQQIIAAAANPHRLIFEIVQKAGRHRVQGLINGHDIHQTVVEDTLHADSVRYSANVGVQVKVDGLPPVDVPLRTFTTVEMPGGDYHLTVQHSRHTLRPGRPFDGAPYVLFFTATRK